MAPYKTSYRAKLNLSQGVNAASNSHGSQEQDEETTSLSASRSPRFTLAQSEGNHKNPSKIVGGNGGQIKASTPTRPLGGSVHKRLSKPEPFVEASETHSTSSDETLVEGADNAEDLILWPPPGETLPAGAAPEAKVPAYINSRLLPHQVRQSTMILRCCGGKPTTCFPLAPALMPLWRTFESMLLSVKPHNSVPPP